MEKTFRRLLPMLLAAFAVAGCVAAPAPRLLMEDAVIETDAVWRGRVEVRGVVTVKKGARLLIRPGTRIVFAPLDRDGDGIGDSELRVEGELIARGTPESPILFTSGAEKPRRGDWKYLYLDFARPSLVQHVIAEYAYSGIQIHFGRARVLDSVFRHNVDGVRFSTVNLEVAGNRIYGNTHGLRYEERRSTAHVHHNDIRENEIGIFVVTRSDDRALIEQNNIVGSGRYQVKLGLEQAADVTLPRNWWGSADPQVVAAGFFDRHFDPKLGRVWAPEPRTTPVSIENRHSIQGETP